MSVVDDLERVVNTLREHDNKPTKMLMPKEAYDMIDPNLIAEKGRQFDCEIVPVEHKVMKPEPKVRRLQFRPQDAMLFRKRGRNKRK